MECYLLFYKNDNDNASVWHLITFVNTVYYLLIFPVIPITTIASISPFFLKVSHGKFFNISRVGHFYRLDALSDAQPNSVQWIQNPKSKEQYQQSGKRRLRTRSPMAVKLMFKSWHWSPNLAVTSTQMDRHMQGIVGRKSVTISCRLWNAVRTRPSLQQATAHGTHPLGQLMTHQLYQLPLLLVLPVFFSSAGSANSIIA